MWTIARWACWIGIAALAATKIWAGITGDLAATMATAGDNPWGVVSLVMLYSGLIALAGVIWRVEPRRTVALGVMAAMPLIGSIAPALWLVWRGLDLIRRKP